MSDLVTTSWVPVRDYEDSPDSLAMKELRSLHGVWEEQKHKIQSGRSFAQFDIELKREWAIETGLIERLYTLDRGITQILITNGILADYIPSNTSQNAKQIELLIKDHESALDHLFSFVKQVRQLTPSYIKELHGLITSHQETCEAIDQFGHTVEVPLLKGEYKRQPNNPTRKNGLVHQYCPPEHVAAEMEKLCDLHQEHLKDKIAPEVEAAWLHHGFTSIHPFQDGNGRVARALASLVFIQADWFPLTVREKDRTRYIEALESADEGQLKDLATFFGEMQKKNFVSALSIARITERASERKQQISETRRRLQQRKTSLQKELSQAITIAKKLHSYSYEQLNHLRKELTKELGPPLLPGSEFRVAIGDERTHTDYYYRHQIVEVAKRLDYYADTRTYRSWVRLDMRDGLQGVLLIAFHGLGQDFNGLLACSGIWFEKVQSEEVKNETTTPIPLTTEPFIINYRESTDSVKERFEPWLDECATRAIQCFEFGAFE